MVWIWWAPLAASAAHITEEFFIPGGFAEWDRAYRPQIRKSITKRLHIIVNGALLLFALDVALLGSAGMTIGRTRVASSIPPPLAVPAWIALAALLASNAVWHVVGTIRTGRYSPGVCTGILIYIPLAIYGFAHFLHAGATPVVAAVIAALIGGSYHLWAALLHARRTAHQRAG